MLLCAALAGCRGETKAGEPGAGPLSGGAADYFSCRRDADCIVEAQRDCCPCSAGGKQVAIAKKAAEAYRAARAGRCVGDLLCPQVYLCDDQARAVCRAGRCDLIGGGPRPLAPAPPR